MVNILQSLAARRQVFRGKRLQGNPLPTTSPSGATRRRGSRSKRRGTPEVKSQALDESLEWTMLDNNYDQRTRNVFVGPIFLPIWWGRYDPGFHPVSTGRCVCRHAVIRRQPFAGQHPGFGFRGFGGGRRPGLSGKVLGDVKSFTSGVTTAPTRCRLSRSSGGGGKVSTAARLCLRLRLRRLRLRLCGWRQVMDL